MVRLAWLLYDVLLHILVSVGKQVATMVIFIRGRTVFTNSVTVKGGCDGHYRISIFLTRMLYSEQSTR